METKKMSTQEKEAIVKRNSQLLELISIDGGNRYVYEQELINNNIRLVSAVLSKYRPYTEDDFQTGCIGLIKAARSINPEKKVPFANYAWFLIEREIITSHNTSKEWFENAFKNNGGRLFSLDDTFDWGKDEQVSAAEVVADEVAALDFIKLFDDFELCRIFTEVIAPILDAYCNATTATRSYDPVVWRNLEYSLILDLADIEPIEGGMTIAKMARILQLSTTNLRRKHENIMAKVKKSLIEKNFITNEE